MAEAETLELTEGEERHASAGRCRRSGRVPLEAERLTCRSAGQEDEPLVLPEAPANQKSVNEQTKPNNSIKGRFDDNCNQHVFCPVSVVLCANSELKK